MVGGLRQFFIDMRSSLHQRRVKDDRARDDEHVARPLRSLLARFASQKRFDPRRLRDAVLNLHAHSPVKPSSLAEVYQSVLSKSSAPARKRAGVYYTPRPLVDLLVRQTLPADARETGIQKTPGNPFARESQPVSVFDPACGCGAFLVAAIQHLREGAIEQVFGIDIDPVAAELCRVAIALQTGDFEKFRQLERQIRCCDAIAEDPANLLAKLGVTDGFDVILTNPPFVNAIENASSRSYRSDLSAIHPLVKGAADYSSYFLSQSIRLVRPEGTIGIILPRASLNAPSLADLRANLPDHLAPNLIVTPHAANLFPGAQVFICALVLGDGNICRVASTLNLEDVRVADLISTNWWEVVHRHRTRQPLQAFTEVAPHRVAQARSSTIDSDFEVHASMTAADAYDVRALIQDRSLGSGQKLVTTGLIDPGVCKWGSKPCRYLGRDFNYPRVIASRQATISLRRRLERSRRPKLIVAGLSKRIECFVDDKGEFIGAVSTYSIFHPTDDVQALKRLAATLLSPDATRHFVQQLGGNAMGGGNTTMKREFLRKFPLRSRRIAG